MPNVSRIEINPEVMLGKPVIRGTRIPVELIVRKVGEGATDAELLDAYPRLVVEDIRAAVLYAADALTHEETVLVEYPSISSR
jgi:uncharacterized protein (DUF433 family)